MSASFSTETDSSTRIQTPQPKRLTLITRLTIAMVGGGILALLALAAWLEPSPNGLGTHQQLGLPPCTFRVLFGERCPSCGMTTAWANVMNGHLGRALQANTGGTLLAVVSLGVVPWLLVSAIRGRWTLFEANDAVLMIVAASFVAITLVDWAWRLLTA